MHVACGNRTIYTVLPSGIPSKTNLLYSYILAYYRLCSCVIPRLHDEAGSTSWLVERSTSQLHRVNGVLLSNSV